MQVLPLLRRVQSSVPLHVVSVMMVGTSIRKLGLLWSTTSSNFVSPYFCIHPLPNIYIYFYMCIFRFAGRFWMKLGPSIPSHSPPCPRLMFTEMTGAWRRVCAAPTCSLTGSGATSELTTSPPWMTLCT